MKAYYPAQFLAAVNSNNHGFYSTDVYLNEARRFGVKINPFNINVSRIIERSSEIGIRKAFGASSRTLVGQFIVENVILTLIGGTVGFLISITALEIVSGSGIVPYGEFTLNIRIFLYCFAICLFFALFSGVYPAFKMSRLHPVDALRGVEQ